MDQFNSLVTNILHTDLPQSDTTQVLVSLGAAMLFSLILWGTYRFANTSASYQPRFAVTLVALALLSTVIMNLIQFNLALSLGMLGSFSIVRFRTNIRDPRDMGFIFWSMAIGLASSTGCYLIGLSGSLVLSAFMLATRKRSSSPDEMMLVIRGSVADPGKIQSIVEKGCAHCKVKAKNMLSDSFELVYEVRVMTAESDGMIRSLFDLGGIDSVNLLAGQKLF